MPPHRLPSVNAIASEPHVPLGGPRVHSRERHHKIPTLADPSCKPAKSNWLSIRTTRTHPSKRSPLQRRHLHRSSNRCQHRCRSTVRSLTHPFTTELVTRHRSIAAAKTRCLSVTDCIAQPVPVVWLAAPPAANCAAIKHGVLASRFACHKTDGCHSNIYLGGKTECLCHH